MSKEKVSVTSQAEQKNKKILKTRIIARCKYVYNTLGNIVRSIDVLAKKSTIKMGLLGNGSWHTVYYEK